MVTGSFADLCVADVSRSIAFYQMLLDLEVLVDHGWYAELGVGAHCFLALVRRGHETIPASAGEPGRCETTTAGRSFNDRLAHVFGVRAPSSLAVLRIGFGSIEGIAVELGSAVVAEVLRIAASRIACALRSGDIVDRIGTEEFACVLLGLPSREQMTHLACKMIDLLSEPIQLAGRQVALCPSIGIAMCPADGTTSDELITAASQAMRRARDQESQYAFSNARAVIWASQFSNLCER